MSHTDLINSLTEFYSTLAALTYITPADIINPPSSGKSHQNVDTEAAKEQGFSSSIISLMQSLPYLSPSAEDTPIALPPTKPRSYLDDDWLDWSRDPTFSGSPTIRPTDLVLTNPGKAGVVLIYCSETGECVSWSPSTSPSTDYSSFPPSAPVKKVLGEWTRNWISLHWMPYSEDNGWREIIEEPTETELMKAAKSPILREQYQIKLVRRGLKYVYVSCGWDVHARDLESAKKVFDGEGFKRKRGEWKKATQAVLDKAYAERWAWVEIRQRLNLHEETAALLDEELKCSAADVQASRRLGSRPDAGNPCALLRV